MAKILLLVALCWCLFLVFGGGYVTTATTVIAAGVTFWIVGYKILNA